MNRLLLLVPIMTVLAAPASAQTILSLTASGSASAVPDEAVAELEVQATKPDAAAAQAAVNQATAKALAAAKAIQGVTATTGNYNTYSVVPDQQKKPAFTAQQSLTLVQPAQNGVPDAAFSHLLATLQSDGLLLTGLNGDLSATAARKLQRDATLDALDELRTQAKSIADALHEKVGALQNLNVDTAGGFAPPIGPRMMAMAASAPAPQSAPDKMSITTRVSAKIELTPAP